MARKQALRELQTRLAERMRVARTQARGRAWLAVECAGRGFLIPLTDAGEIFSAVPLVSLPHAQPWCLGVANLRGQLHTVIDLAAFLGIGAVGGRPAAASTASPPAADDGAAVAPNPGHPPGHHPAQLLAFNPSLEINAALRLDRLAGLRNEAQMTPLLADGSAPGEPPAGAPTGPPAAGSRPSFAGARLRDADGRVWQELSLAALAGHAAFLRIGA